MRKDSCQFSTHYRVDVVVAIGSPTAAVELSPSAKISRWSSPHLIGIASPNILSSNFILGQDRNNIEHSIFGESGGAVVVVELELPIAPTGKSDVVPPLAEVESVEVVLEDQFGVHRAEDQK